jgi:pyruvate/2-oxoglutarate dehydrogenase complex dihydrolipoamide dehydrogenase (E3) component
VRSGERETWSRSCSWPSGRRPNLERLRLDRLGVPMGDHGVPIYDPETLRVGRTSVYLAGDAAGGIANLQRAAAQGRIAGFNACIASASALAGAYAHGHRLQRAQHRLRRHALERFDERSMPWPSSASARWAGR